MASLMPKAHDTKPRFCRGSEQASPRCTTLTCELLCAEGNQDSADSQETFIPLP